MPRFLGLFEHLYLGIILLAIPNINERIRPLLDQSAEITASAVASLYES
jgi:hypothetical protein